MQPVRLVRWLVREDEREVRQDAAQLHAVHATYVLEMLHAMRAVGLQGKSDDEI